MPYSFTPPTIQVGYAGPLPVQGAGLFRRMKIAVGQSLLKKDGFYTQVVGPSSDDIVNADIAYIGGYQYIVSDAEAVDLINAGYLSGLGPVIPPDPGDGTDPIDYGAGVYGVGTYGR